MDYYHITIESFSRFDKKRFRSSAFDKSKEEIIQNYLEPYYRLEEFFLDGRPLSREVIERIKIIRSSSPISVLIDRKQSQIPAGVIMIVRPDDFFLERAAGVEDVTSELMKEAKGE